MPITFTYDNLTDRQPWKNVFYNTLKDNIASAVGNLDGTDLKKPFTLGGNINGAQYAMFRFRKWMGNGSSDVGVRDICGYGAVMDGATDDAAAIQAAIDDLPTTGGCILVPPGTAMVSTTLLLAGSAGTKSNVTLMGFGNASVLKLKASATDAPLIRLGYGPTKSTGMQVRDLRLEGNATNNSTATQQCGVSLEDSIGAYVANVTANDFNADGMTINGSEAGHISMCQLTNNDRYGIGSGADQKTASHIRITKCRIYDNDDYGIYLNSAVDSVISGCSITANLGGIKASPSVQLGLGGIAIGGCFIYNNAEEGIYLLNLYDATTIETFAINNNIIYDNGRNGIYMDGTSGTIVAIAISGNQITGQTDDGIRAYGTVKYSTICANSIIDNGLGVRLGHTTTGAVEFVTITGNSLCNTATGSQTYGFALGEMSANNVVVGNTVSGNDTAPYVDLGVNNDVSHNVGA